MTKIVIVDDHTLFSHSLSGLINSLGDYEVLAMLKNGRELVDFYTTSKERPDIVLLDIRMPVMDGIEVMGWLKKNHPHQKVLALTMEHEEEIMIQMLNSGCRGYLLKDIEPEEFRDALEEVMLSGYYLKKELLEVLDHSEDGKENVLTTREIEFLHLVCTERTYKEIAGEMCLSPKTIDGYREQLFGKLNVKSRTGVVLHAIKNRIVNI